jgi:hypothetical protein
MAASMSSRNARVTPNLNDQAGTPANIEQTDTNSRTRNHDNENALVASNAFIEQN